MNSVVYLSIHENPMYVWKRVLDGQSFPVLSYWCHLWDPNKVSAGHVPDTFGGRQYIRKGFGYENPRFHH